MINRRLLVHIENNLLRNPILRHKNVARAKNSYLIKLIGDERQGADDVFVRPKIVECAIAISKDLQIQGSTADGFAIDFDFGPWLSSLHRNVISHGAGRTAFDARRQWSFAARK